MTVKDLLCWIGVVIILGAIAALTVIYPYKPQF